MAPISELETMHRSRTFLAHFRLSIWLLTLPVLAFNLESKAQGDERGYRVEIGDAVPDFNLTDLQGSSWSREALLGKVYILQFTASWCGVCRKEMPHLESRVWQAYREKGLQLLGVDLDEPTEKVQGLVDDTGVTYPVCLDPGGRLFQEITVPKAGVTRNVVVDRNGRIAFLTRLFDEREFEAMIGAVEALLESE